MLLSLRLLLSSCRQRPLCGQPRPNCLPRWCSSRRYWRWSPRLLRAEPGVRVRCRQRALRFSRNVSSRLRRSVGRDASSAGSPCRAPGLPYGLRLPGLSGLSRVRRSGRGCRGRSRPAYLQLAAGQRVTGLSGRMPRGRVALLLPCALLHAQSLRTLRFPQLLRPVCMRLRVPSRIAASPPGVSRRPTSPRRRV